VCYDIWVERLMIIITYVRFCSGFSVGIELV